MFEAPGCRVLERAKDVCEALRSVSSSLATVFKRRAEMAKHGGIRLPMVHFYLTALFIHPNIVNPLAKVQYD